MSTDGPVFLKRDFCAACVFPLTVTGSVFLGPSASIGPQHASCLRMGGSGSKAKGVWPFSGGGAGGDPTSDGTEQSVARLRGSRGATPFVFTRRRWVTPGRHVHSRHQGLELRWTESRLSILRDAAFSFPFAFSHAEFILKAQH